MPNLASINHFVRCLISSFIFPFPCLLFPYYKNFHTSITFIYKSMFHLSAFHSSARQCLNKESAENTVQKHRRKNDNHHSGKKSVIIGVKGCCESRQKRRYCQLFPCDQHKRGPVILIPIIQKRKHSCCHNSRTCNWENYLHPGLYIATSVNSRRLFQLSWDIVVIVLDHKKAYCNSTAGINQDQSRSCII